MVVLLLVVVAVAVAGTGSWLRRCSGLIEGTTGS
jgi:hypothetical protein